MFIKRGQFYYTSTGNDQRQAICKSQQLPRKGKYGRKGETLHIQEEAYLEKTEEMLCSSD